MGLLPVNADGSGFQEVSSTGITCLIAREKDGIFLIVSKTIQVPKSRSTFQHTRRRNDDIGSKCFLSIRFTRDLLCPSPGTFER